MNSIRRVNWNEIKSSIEKINVELFNVLNNVGGISELSFYLAKYGFGEYFGIKNQFRVPNSQRKIVSVTDSSVEEQVKRELAYGAGSAPLGLVLNNSIEFHHIDKDEKLFPSLIANEGHIFNINIVFQEEKAVENNYLSASSGALSSFMLPNIGCRNKHVYLKRELAIDLLEPKSPYEHYHVFKEIVRNTGDDWHATTLYFSEEFVNRVKDDESWLKVKLYLSECYREKILRRSIDISSEDLLLSSNRINRYRPTPYFVDTAKYVFRILTGKALGVAPATDESSFPLKTIQTVYREIYGLPYTPTIMVPQLLNEQTTSVYYPMLYPITKIDTFRTHISRSAHMELEQLKDLLDAYQEEFISEDNLCYGSPLYDACRRTSLSYYHFRASPDGPVSSSRELEHQDSRFQFSYTKPGDFPYDAKLFRGCIKVTREPYVELN